MALRAAHCQAQPHGASRLDAIHHVLHPSLLGDAATLAVDHVIAVEPRRQFLLLRRIRQEITRKLPDRELVVAHVVVDRLHHPIPPRPHRALGIALVAVRVRIACRIQPIPGPALTQLWRIQQPLHHLGVIFAQLLRSRRQPNQIQRHPPQQRLRICLWRRLHPFLRQLRQHKGINRIDRSRTILALLWGQDAPTPCRHFRPLDSLKRPVLAPFRTFVDPLLE